MICSDDKTFSNWLQLSLTLSHDLDILVEIKSVQHISSTEYIYFTILYLYTVAVVIFHISHFVPQRWPIIQREKKNDKNKNKTYSQVLLVNTLTDEYRIYTGVLYKYNKNLTFSFSRLFYEPSQSTKKKTTK